MTDPDRTQDDAPSHGLLPWWLAGELTAINSDFSQRVVQLPQDAQWLPTRIPGLELRVLESVPAECPRLTAQLRLDPEHSPAELGHNAGLELLIQRGEMETGMGVYPPGLYVRVPLIGEEPHQDLTLRCLSMSDTTAATPEVPALLYMAAGQMPASDTEHRRLNTLDETRWLPGPVEGTDVMPLHGHGTGNVMLIRWHADVAFKPRLDPMGEELLVLTGTVQDSTGEYAAGSWIRNPVAAWQSWGADAGTVVYYKNGHFADPPPHS